MEDDFRDGEKRIELDVLLFGYLDCDPLPLVPIT